MPGRRRTQLTCAKGCVPTATLTTLSYSKPAHITPMLRNRFWRKPANLEEQPSEARESPLVLFFVCLSRPSSCRLPETIESRADACAPDLLASFRQCTRSG